MTVESLYMATRVLQGGEAPQLGYDWLGSGGTCDDNPLLAGCEGAAQPGGGAGTGGALG